MGLNFKKQKLQPIKHIEFYNKTEKEAAIHKQISIININAKSNSNEYIQNKTCGENIQTKTCGENIQNNTCGENIQNQICGDIKPDCIIEHNLPIVNTAGLPSQTIGDDLNARIIHSEHDGALIIPEKHELIVFNMKGNTDPQKRIKTSKQTNILNFIAKK